MTIGKRTSSPAILARHLPARQRGVVLFVALIVLVAMTMAGIALMRSSGTGILIAGNLAFKQNATTSGDAGVEAARAWLNLQGPVTLENNVAAQGYYAAWDTAFNPFTSNIWTTPNAVRQLAPDAAGNTVRYVIHRMCNGTGSVTGVPCVTVSGTGSGSSKSVVVAGETPLSGTAQVYYRITAQIAGPKNTLSYVQAMIY